ncbi:Alpha/Beta hydrolase protein [Aspergillus unguis]
MPSPQSRLVGDLFTRLNKHLGQKELDVDLYRIIQEEHASIATEPPDVTYSEVQCPGTVRPAIWCSPHSASPQHVILYLHGGGFISGSPSSHRKLAAHLAKRAGCLALVLDYRRAPDNAFPTQIDDVVAAYKWLRDERGFAAQRIAFAGDSAGGNLTVSASLALRELGGDGPAAVAAFSPWFDMRLTGESWKRNASTDLLVVPEAMTGVIAGYIGQHSLDTPGLDLLRTDLTRFPPMYLASGKAEVLEDDAVLLAENARRCGVEVELEQADGMQHIWVLMAGNAPEADSTLEQAARFIRSKMMS